MITCVKTGEEIADTVETLIASIKSGDVRAYRTTGRIAVTSARGDFDPDREKANRAALAAWGLRSNAALSKVVRGESPTPTGKPKTKATTGKPKTKATTGKPKTKAPDTSALVITAETGDDAIERYAESAHPDIPELCGFTRDMIAESARGGNRLAMKQIVRWKDRARAVKAMMKERDAARAAADRAASEAYREERREAYRAEREERAVTSAAPTADSFTVRAAHLAVAARYAQVSLTAGQTVKIGKRATVSAESATVLEGDLEVLAMLGLVKVGDRTVTRLQD